MGVEADKQLVYNLRFRWTQVSVYTDEELVKIYDDFALSDQFGNNDENFPKWIADYEPGNIL